MEETIFVEGGEEMITIQGIRVDEIKIDDEGKIQGKYSIITDQNKAIATQCFNDYSGIKIDFSTETKKLVSDLAIAIKKEIEVTFGMV